MTEPTDQLLHHETLPREQLLRQAALLARARRDGIAGHRATIRDLTIILALTPYTRATDAPPGKLGRPIGPSDDELGPPPPARTPAQIPRQPRQHRPGRLLRAAERARHDRRRP